jgi:alpha-galactosidase
MRIYFLIMKKVALLLIFTFCFISLTAQVIAPTPPMGWMSWNLMAEDVNENGLKKMADAMVSSGMSDAGYKYIYIDDGWQGGRDNQNNMIPDPKKFPSGIKALAAYMHTKGLKLSIYSDAAQLTCGGYTASYGFERQDAQTFAAWGIDYLKYDYCGAPEDSITSKIRYKAMADALHKSGHDIAFGICEWGIRYPWNWGASVGGQLWRMGGDIRDKWKDLKPNRNPKTDSFGILDAIINNAPLFPYAGPGRWNDMDMLIVGMYGKEGPSSMYDGKGCTDIEYQTQMSMWCMMAAPLSAGNDLTNMNDATKRILLNKEMIAINQDALGKQAQPKITNDNWYVFSKPLANGDYAVSILNLSTTEQNYELLFKEIGLTNKYEIRDVWEHKVIGKGTKWKGEIRSHETKVFRLRKI